VKEQVAEFLARADTMREAIELELGGPLAHRDVLEIGPGQKRAHLCYFARNNRYIGVDLDVPIEKLTLPALWRILYSNGGIRAAKTLARHIIGADAAFRRELGEHINVNNLSAQLHHMDAAQLTFSDSSFDVVFSISVFEHLPDVPGALKQIDRVLRPGGVAYIVTHIYTSDSGVHDPRLFGEREDIPYWSHLRPQLAHLVRPNCYINKLRLAEYQRAFREAWPSADLSYLPDLDKRAGPALAEVRAKGELPDYSDEELLTNSIVTVWKKGN
jgi:SAM-dependent methyltransferase